MSSSSLSLLSSPSFHHISPLARSNSDVRSSAMRRSNSYSGPPTERYSGGSSFTGGFTRPSYGYGGGYMSKTLSRSGSSLFGRSLLSSALTQTPPLHGVGVQRSTPHYSDKYPYVRYSYGNTDTHAAILSQINATSTTPSTIKDLGTKRWLEGKLNTYNTGLFSRPYTEQRVERPIAPARTYVRYMPVDDAVDMYKKRCMTVGTLSKYWLSPATWTSRREKELNLGSNISTGNYSYASRFQNRASYQPSYQQQYQTMFSAKLY